jgi:hypothetical protein
MAGLSTVLRVRLASFGAIFRVRRLALPALVAGILLAALGLAVFPASRVSANVTADKFESAVSVPAVVVQPAVQSGLALQRKAMAAAYAAQQARAAQLAAWHQFHVDHLVHVARVRALAAEAAAAAVAISDQQQSSPAPGTPARSSSVSAQPAVQPAFSSGCSDPSGVLSGAQVAMVWNCAGGPVSQDAAAIAITMCESGHNTQAYNPSGATGLFQILGSVVPGDLYDAHVNALNAVDKFNQAGGWSPWVCQP